MTTDTGERYPMLNYHALADVDRRLARLEKLTGIALEDYEETSVERERRLEMERRFAAS